MVNRRKKRLKAPNGFGTINYLGERRKKPYQAIVTIGWDSKGKQIRKSIGTAESYPKAYDLLLQYTNDNYDIDISRLTIENIFEKLQPILEKDVIDNKMSQSNYRNLLSVYYNQLNNIHKEKIIDLKKRDLQTLIDSSYKGYTTRGYMKNMLIRLYNYAIDELDSPIQKNFAKDLKIGNKEKSTLHTPFSKEEIELLWNYKEYDLVKIILIYIYTGTRTSELLTIKKENVFINDSYMIGGSKTLAGKERLIPLHSDIIEFVRYFYDRSNIEYLITSKTGLKLNLRRYEEDFKSIMLKLKLNHTPYDTRHTFATLADDNGLSETNIKVILGHSLSGDITNHVYIHKNKDLLIQEINKIKINK